MAVVKFVSDKDCQLFIDMELAGKVTSDSMLKLTLETGGYLIQVKDEDGNLIKEYDLEIKPSDNQLLQKIDRADDKLDDIIENLKNDSSLVFHCNRASFCHNGLYGFVDKKLNVVIPPIYYSVNDIRDDFFYYNNLYDWFGEYEPFGPIKWKFIPIWQGNKWNVRVSIALIGTADNKEKAFVIECDYILKMGHGFCICKIGKIVKVIIADIIEEGFYEFSFIADNVKPILRTDKAVNGDDPIFPKAFQVYYGNKMETIDMNMIQTNSKWYGYNRYS